jgi:hypothetical protein
MKRFTNAGRKAIADNNLYAALSLALMMPDVCASLEDPGTGKVAKRYLKWCQKWVVPRFTSPATAHRPEKVWLSAEDCFQLRNSLIHSGSAEIEPSKRDVLDRIEFFDKTCGSHLGWVEGMIFNGVRQPNFLQLKADLFSEEMYKAAEEWDAAMVSNPSVQKEKAKLLVIRTKGAVISGVGFS